jgi:hypothetical protein
MWIFHRILKYFVFIFFADLQSYYQLKDDSVRADHLKLELHDLFQPSDLLSYNNGMNSLLLHMMN